MHTAKFSITSEQMKLEEIEKKKGFYYLKSPYWAYVTIDGVTYHIYMHMNFYTDLMSGPSSIKKKHGIKQSDYKRESLLHDCLFAFREAYVFDDDKGTLKTVVVSMNFKQRDILYILEACGNGGGRTRCGEELLESLGVDSLV